VQNKDGVGMAYRVHLEKQEKYLNFWLGNLTRRNHIGGLFRWILTKEFMNV